MSGSPLFETTRLTVSFYDAASQRSVLAADPDVLRFSQWPDAADAAFARSIAAMRGRRVGDGGGWFNLAIADHEGAYVGDHAVLIEGSAAKLGIALLLARRGFGLAGELLAGSIAWLRGFGVTRFVAEIDPDNAASLAVFGRAGFARIRLDRDDGGPFWIFERR